MTNQKGKNVIVHPESKFKLIYIEKLRNKFGQTKDVTSDPGLYKGLTNRICALSSSRKKYLASNLATPFEPIKK